MVLVAGTIEVYPMRVDAGKNLEKSFSNETLTDFRISKRFVESFRHSLINYSQFYFSIGERYQDGNL